MMLQNTMVPKGSEEEKLLGGASKDYGSSSGLLPSKRTSCCADHDHHRDRDSSSAKSPAKKACCGGHDHSHDHDHGSSSESAKQACCGGRDHSHGSSSEPAKQACCGGRDHSHHNRTPSPPLLMNKTECGSCSSQSHDDEHSPLLAPKTACCGGQEHSHEHGSSAANSLEAPLLPSTKMDPATDQTIVRSTIHCKGICCSSEVPELMEILTPINGIAEVKVNVPLKQILIDHDWNIICATKIVEILEEELFPSTVERDGGAALANIVRSTFSTKGICCSSEVPFILEILTPYQGIVDVKVVVPVKQVVVDHDCKLISAAKIASILTDEEFETTVQRDGGGPKTLDVEGRSKFLVGGICCSSEIPTIRSILEPLEGVKGLLVTVSTKMVYVDHSASIISADEIAEALNSEGFEAKVKYDCFKDAGGFLSSFVVSKFSIHSSSPTMVKDLKSFLKTFDADQIEGYQTEKKAMTVTIIHNPLLISAKGLSESILEATKIETVVVEDGNKANIWDSSEDSLDDQANVLGGIRPAIAIAGVFWMISMISKFGESFHYLSYFGLVSVVFGIPPIAIKAFKAASRGMTDTNVLMFLAVVGAVLLKEFEEAAAVAFLFSLSEWLETRASRRANEALKSIVSLKPERANIIQPKTKELIVVPATSVPVGSLVAVKSGDKIPCDGVIVEGHSTLDESSLTGESRPVKKGPNDEVSGGTVNSGNTQIVVRTTRTSDDSAVSRLIRLVEEAQANRSETEKIVDSFAKVYTPIVVIGALAMCTIPWCWGAEIGRSYMSRGLSLVVIACPCALVISTPVSYVAGLAATAQNGVLVKGGAHLEALGQLKHVCFDKTGTLTMGEFKLLKLVVFGAKSKREVVLQYLALMEERATHPLAKSLVDGIKAEGINIPTSLLVKDHTFLAGEGVKGSINGKKVYVGNERLFHRLGMFKTIPAAQRQEVDSWEGTIGFVSIGDEGIVCAYCVADAPRPESAEVIEELKTMGMNVQMLTGDKTETALAIGQRIGMNKFDIASELLPTEKLELISNLKTDTNNSNPLLSLFFAKPRLVLMCGDGVNDAPSLVVANVGVAMGEGAALAMETADVTLMDSNLTKLSYSIKMGKRVIQKIRENVVFSIVVKVAVLFLTLTNRVGLWAAIGSDVGSMIVVTLNGMALLPKKEKKVEIVA